MINPFNQRSTDFFSLFYIRGDCNPVNYISGFSNKIAVAESNQLGIICIIIRTHHDLRARVYEHVMINR